MIQERQIICIKNRVMVLLHLLISKQSRHNPVQETSKRIHIHCLSRTCRKTSSSETKKDAEKIQRNPDSTSQPTFFLVAFSPITTRTNYNSLKHQNRNERIQEKKSNSNPGSCTALNIRK